MKTATDVISEIEEKVSNIDKRIANIELLLKTLLSNVNKLNAKISEASNATNNNYSSDSNSFSPPIIEPVPSKIINKDNFDERPITNKFEEAAAQYGIKVDSIEESQPGRGDIRRKPVFGNTVNVSQKLYRQGKPLFLASVSIVKKENNERVARCRTNSEGKWMAGLIPGTYQINVTKNTKDQEVEKTYEIEVLSEGTQIELDSVVFE